MGRSNLNVSQGDLRFSQLSDPSRVTTEWDDFVASVDSGHIFQSARWATYKQRVGWRPILLSWSANGSLKAVCLVLHRSVSGLPFGGILYVPRGPVLDYDSSEAPYLLSKVLDRLKQLARSHFAVVRVSPNLTNDAIWVKQALMGKRFIASEHPIQHTSNITIDLTRSLDELITGMERRRRKEIRRFERDGVDWSFQCVNTSDGLDILYPLYYDTISQAGATLKSLNDIKQMHETLVSYDSSFIFIVNYQDHPVAGVVALTLGNRLWPYYAGTAKGDNAVSGAGVVLHWEVIKWAKNHGYVEYPLQGMPDVSGPDDPLYGVYLFKRGWGGRYVRLIGEYDYSPYPLLGRLLDRKLSR